MLDKKWIRENKEAFDTSLIKRGMEPMSHIICSLDEEHRKLLTSVQELRYIKNTKSKELGAFADKSSQEFEILRKDVDVINEKLHNLLQELEKNDELQTILANTPNLLSEDVPFGVDENDNALIRSVGKKTKMQSLEHFEVGEKLKMMDFTQTAKISGSRFVTLTSDLARLERALVGFMLDINVNEFGFTEVSPPYIVRERAMYNVGQLPKFDKESFAIDPNYRLIPTGEVPLTNLASDMTLELEQMPIRYTAYTPCFRSEAGSAGRDVRGMIRMHQFGKVELVSITTQEDSAREHEYATNAAEEILKRLELPYRVMLLCAGDTGFAASKTYDIEVWMPAQGKYREISSCSNFKDFQARRMQTKYRIKSHGGKEDKIFAHTINGSALPTGRTIAAILENYSNSDGTEVIVPDKLVPYMGGKTKIHT